MSQSTATLRPTDELVVVLDFGGQYSQLIARRVRECQVFCEMVPCDTPMEEILAKNPIGIIFSGGPNSVYEPDAPTVDMAIFDSGIPILGICYGHQLIAKLNGGSVVSATNAEYGKTHIDILGGKDLYAGLNKDLIGWMSHSDTVEIAPEGFEVTAKTTVTPVAGMADHARRIYSTQIHIEVAHTPWGMDVFRNFLYNICGAKGLWTMGSFIDNTVAAIREQVGDKKVICGLSGGVDSVVVAALIHKAIGAQLTCIFVNTGLLRMDEGTQVKRNLGEHLNINLVYADEKERFLDRLKGISDPELKRKTIGKEFIEVFDEIAATIDGAEYLAQGTLYSDVVESGGTKKGHLIKSHHNVGGLPEHMKLKLVEPLRLLFKDEVRKVGEELGLPSEMVWRQPFPGPGLAIRILGEVTLEKLTILRHADSIIVEEIKKAGLYRKVWQSFGVLPDVKSVGVSGDFRTYAYPVVLRCVSSDDAMTASAVHLPWELLERISSRIVGEVDGVNRVVYDLTSKPPGTIEWE